MKDRKTRIEEKSKHVRKDILKVTVTKIFTNNTSCLTGLLLDGKNARVISNTPLGEKVAKKE